jgi:hypothetical protein
MYFDFSPHRMSQVRTGLWSSNYQSPASTVHYSWLRPQSDSMFTWRNFSPSRRRALLGHMTRYLASSLTIILIVIKVHPLWGLKWYVHCQVFCTLSSTNTLNIYLYMAIQPFVGPWLFFSFLILHTVGRAPGRGISPSQGRYLHTEQNKHRINAHKHSNPRSQFLSRRRLFMS